MSPAPTRHRVSDRDRDFVTRFEACLLPLAEFDHRGHLRLAYVYLADLGPTAAIASMRGALVRFIARNGVPAAKYHETLTRAWLSAVHECMQQGAGADSAEAFIAAHPALLDPQHLLRHYSEQRLFSEEARTGFVAPDLAPFPDAHGRSSRS